MKRITTILLPICILLVCFTSCGTCEICDGSQIIACRNCNGKGNELCDICHGNGMCFDDDCYKGKKTVSQDCQICEKGFMTDPWVFGSYICQVCDGSGYLIVQEDCNWCNGTGKCACGGSGIEESLICGECNGSGTMTCPYCEDN
jgi:hypothetical protein